MPTPADELRARTRGPVFEPGVPGYDDARSIWNGMIDRHPALVLRCIGTADVIAGIHFARTHGLPLCVKGGGHNVAGLAVAEGALMLDMSAMRGVWVDPGVRLAHAQPGCLLSDVDQETQLHGLAAALGFVSTTGVAGLTLGGGFGYLTRRLGWTCDTLESVQMVTADGRRVRASSTENPDLFWALRGGGGNFGVATGFTYRLYPLGPEIFGGALAWPIAEAPRVLERFREITASAPPELALVAVLRAAPPAPWIAKEYHGKLVVMLLVCWTGPLAEGEGVVAPLRALGKLAGDVVQRRPWVSQQTLLDAANPKGRRYYWKSEYLAGHPPELLQAALGQIGSVPSPHSAVIFFPLGGAIAKLPADHSPMGNRDAVSLFNVAGSWERPEDDAKNIAWVRKSWERLKPFSTGGTYINFQPEDEGDERIKAALGPHLERLQRVKTEWDPDNFFRANKNIAPA
ncbi:MAG: FAD-binding oxidoreductase [Gemmatimonadetes bacterium]|nr:FAD-binding oxidoreductase [Gemmatimonadota bacterium]